MTDPVIGGHTTLLIRGPAAGAGMVGLGAQAQQDWIAGCRLYIDINGPLFLIPFALSASGDWSARIPIPNDPTLAGGQAALQAGLHLDKLTNGVYLRTGR